WRVLPVAVLLLGTAAFFALGLHRYLSFDELSRHRDALLDWRERHEALAVLTFITVYLLLTALSIPGAVWMTIAGGFLFGIVAGSTYAVIGATIGSCLVFLAARLLASDWLRRRAGTEIGRMEAGFRRDALSYLLVLRLVPIFPFWLVNLVPALLGVPLGTFLIGTLLGIIPGSIVYASVGHGLGAVIAAGGTPDVHILFHWEVLLPLTGLALLALLPVLYRWLKRAPAAGSSDGDDR
ncbi:MAG TPA: TVP38/TMEM64 family protein, partial [Rhodospirillales bacterium]|nr:TVP38/TMEM64 family protein [Rhodospirillales bacterium]